MCAEEAAVLVRMDIKTIVVANGPVPSLVVLSPRKQVEGDAIELPIRIGLVEAAAISTAADGPQERPKTHDLLLKTINRLGGKLVGVAIVDVLDTTFYANLMLEDASGNHLDIDCRPSDALALAVRQGVPIWAEEKVLDTATMPDFARVEHDEREQELERFHDFVEDLNADDFKD